jgi:hypothetical protein
MRSLLILMPLLVSLLEQQHSPGCSIADIREELRRFSSRDISQSDQPLCGAFAACNAARSLGVEGAIRLMRLPNRTLHGLQIDKVVDSRF